MAGPDAIRIRPVARADAAAVAAIYNHYIQHSHATFELQPVTARELRRRFVRVEKLDHPWLVVDSGGALCGYAYAAPWKGRPAYARTAETTIYLHPEAGGRGLGRRLYTALLERLRAAGMHTVIGGIALPNEASVALHESLGFHKVAEFKQVGWKFDRWIDVGYWQRMLEED